MSYTSQAKKDKNRPQNDPKMLRLPHDMDIAQKKTSTLVKRSLNSKGTKKLAAHFLRACAVEIHMDISLPFTREFAREKWAQRAYPDLTPAFNTYGKNPQCGDTVWGIISENSDNLALVLSLLGFSIE